MARPEKLFTTSPVTILSCTEKAVKILESNGNEHWLPFSQITDPEEEEIRSGEGTEMELTVREWIAKEKGFL